MGSARGGKVGAWLWVGSAALSSLGCLDDSARIILPGPADDGSGAAAPPADDGAGNPQALQAGAGSTSAVDGVVSAGQVGTEAAPGAVDLVTGPAGVDVQAQAAPGCWQLPVVDSARIVPASGRAADLVGGKIQASASSPTNGFVDLGEITVAPGEGQSVTLALENPSAYRYVKYYGPVGSFGAVADVQFLSGGQVLGGAGFGSAGSRDELGNVFANALDGDPSTWFEGPLPSDNYVGLDLGAGHELAPPTFSPPPGAAASGDAVSVTAQPGTRLRYTTDGSDPLASGVEYGGAIVLPAGSTLIKAVAVADCALDSPIAQGIYRTEAPLADPASGSSVSRVQSSMHIGNSLTDTINDHLATLAADGGIALDYNRYTIPGAGLWLYDDNPTGGFGVPNVQVELRTRSFDHLAMQPFPNWPCQPVPSSDGSDSDSGYIDHAWSDAMTQNPNVQLWVYQQWPAPADFFNCMSGGRWTRGDWQPDAPATWEDAVATELTYHETVRSALVSLHPEAPPPYIVPGGLALVALKHAIEAGEVPGMTNFFVSLFQDEGSDVHMTAAGAYFITLVFYGSMFQASPEGRVNDSGGALDAAQAAVFQRIAWETVVSYPLSGVDR